MLKLNKLILCTLLSASCVQPALAWPPSLSALAATIVSIARAPITLVRSLLGFAPTPVISMLSTELAPPTETDEQALKAAAHISQPMEIAQAVIYIDENESENRLKIRFVRQITDRGISSWYTIQFDPVTRTRSSFPESSYYGDPINDPQWEMEQLIPHDKRYLFFENAEIDISEDGLLEYYHQLSDPHNPNVLIKD